MFEKTLNEEPVGSAAAVGTENDSNAGVGQFLEVNLVDFESSLVAGKLRVLRLLFPLLGLQHLEPLRRQALTEEGIFDPDRRFAVHEHSLFPRQGGDDRDVALV